MALPNMRFKTYTFPVNPKTISISSKRNIRSNLSPYMGEIVYDFGSGPRIITGEGAFHGDNAWQQYSELYFVYRASGHGLVTLPYGSTITCLFTSLKMTGSSGPNMIKYAFEFLEVNPDSYIT
ncbi:MAG: hypothetical protein FWH14_06480 [Oscillospiraceae bacterium]|nr:hypothetical protein [Oscillospiraceae bacterium]